MIWVMFCVLVTGLLASRAPDGLRIALVQVALLWGALGLAIATRRVIGRLQQRTPTALIASDWRLNETGVRIASPLDERFFDWRGVVRVVEEKDRFVFAVTPAINPVLPIRLLTDDQKTALRALIAEVTASGRMGAGA